MAVLLVLCLRQEGGAQEARPRAVEDAIDAGHRWKTSSQAERGTLNLEEPALRLRDWITEQLETRTESEVRGDLGQWFLVEDLRDNRDWERRFREFNYGLKVEELRPVIVGWRNDRRALYIVRVEYPIAIGSLSSLGTTMPIVLRATGAARSKVQLASDCGLSNFCVVWDIVPAKSAKHWPDILITAGPMGTASGVLIEQYHVVSDRDAWSRMTVQADDGVASITYQIAKRRVLLLANHEGAVQRFEIRHGVVPRDVAEGQ